MDIGRAKAHTNLYEELGSRHPPPPVSHQHVTQSISTRVPFPFLEPAGVVISIETNI